eukprot:SAG31_NODE_162_length_21892_cov_343.171936_23_plen_286_part_00
MPAAIDLLLSRAEEMETEKCARTASFEIQERPTEQNLLEALVDEIFVFLDVNGVCAAEETDPVVAKYIAQCFLDAAQDVEDAEHASQCTPRDAATVEAECLRLLADLYPEFADTNDCDASISIKDLLASLALVVNIAAAAAAATLPAEYNDKTSSKTDMHPSTLKASSRRATEKVGRRSKPACSFLDEYKIDPVAVRQLVHNYAVGIGSSGRQPIGALRAGEYFTQPTGGAKQKRYLDGDVVYAKEVVSDPLASVRKGVDNGRGEKTVMLTAGAAGRWIPAVAGK